MQRWSRMRERVWDFLNAAEYGSEFLYLRELVVDSENYTEAVDEIIADVLESYGPEERVYYTGASYGRAYSPYLADNVETYPDMVREQIARSLAYGLQHPRVIGAGRSALRHPDGEVWLTYQVLVDRTVEITGMEPDYAMVKRLEIPEQVHWEEGGVDCPVSGIAEEAFFGNETLQSIRLPDSIRRIGRAAFSACPALTEVTLPDGWSYVSIAAFDGSAELEFVCSQESYERLEEVGFVYGRYCVDGASMLYQQHW